MALDRSVVNQKFQAYMRLGASRENARRMAEAETGDKLSDATWNGGRSDSRSAEQARGQRKG